MNLTDKCHDNIRVRVLDLVCTYAKLNHHANSESHLKTALLDSLHDVLTYECGLTPDIIGNLSVDLVVEPSYEPFKSITGVQFCSDNPELAFQLPLYETFTCNLRNPVDDDYITDY